MSLPPFEHVVTEHARVVLRVCRALLPDHDAQDAAAETFVSALRAYPGLRPDSDVRAWLVTIAHRKALDVLRARARTVPVAEVPERSGAAVTGVLPGRDDDLWDAVRALPDKQRQAVAYHYVADLPYAEVGALMGTSEAAARRSAADGVKALRRRYPDPGERP
ncbi:MAG TPA: sigma-70 family RNA polymerase sigma factor [Kineosporiaceae bacterium]|nr:sigma-70 family RNA polymerase sigma factor [Kineosporiaceae bacterium]